MHKTHPCIHAHAHTYTHQVVYAGQSTSANGRCGLGPPTTAGIPPEISGLKATVGVSSDMYAFSPCGICIRVRCVLDYMRVRFDLSWSIPCSNVHGDVQTGLGFEGCCCCCCCSW